MIEKPRGVLCCARRSRTAPCLLRAEHALFMPAIRLTHRPWRHRAVVSAWKSALSRIKLATSFIVQSGKAFAVQPPADLPHLGGKRVFNARLRVRQALRFELAARYCNPRPAAAVCIAAGHEPL